MATLIDIPTIHEPSGDLSFLQKSLVGYNLLNIKIYNNYSKTEIIEKNEIIIALKGNVLVILPLEDRQFWLHQPAQALLLEAGTCRKVITQPNSLSLHVAATLHE